MRAIIVDEEYLKERFEAFLNRVKVGYSENRDLEKWQRDSLAKSFVYHAHRFRDEIIDGPKKKVI